MFSFTGVAPEMWQGWSRVFSSVAAFASPLLYKSPFLSSRQEHKPIFKLQYINRLLYLCLCVSLKCDVCLLTIDIRLQRTETSVIQNNARPAAECIIIAIRGQEHNFNWSDSVISAPLSINFNLLLNQ